MASNYFTSASSSKQQILVKECELHSDNHFFLCDLCGRVFARRKSFYLHRRSHTNKKSFVCDICTMSFVYEKRFIKHRTMHLKYPDQEKPLKQQSTSVLNLTSSTLNTLPQSDESIETVSDNCLETHETTYSSKMEKIRCRNITDLIEASEVKKYYETFG